jgi:hypothetical protein
MCHVALLPRTLQNVVTAMFRYCLNIGQDSISRKGLTGQPTSSRVSLISAALTSRTKSIVLKADGGQDSASAVAANASAAKTAAAATAVAGRIASRCVRRRCCMARGDIA